MSYELSVTNEGYPMDPLILDSNYESANRYFIL